MVSNPALCLLARTGRAPKYHVCWEELPTEEEMVQAMLLLNEIAGLSAQGLTGVMVALSFSKRLVQPIQDRVHPGFEYWGCQNPTRGAEPKGLPGRSREPGRPHDARGNPRQRVPEGTLLEAVDQSHKYSSPFCVVLLLFRVVLFCTKVIFAMVSICGVPIGL